jgi:hypothetical protein
MRITPIPPSPNGVEMAAMVSSWKNTDNQEREESLRVREPGKGIPSAPITLKLPDSTF